eukprot:7481769-Alexandrium_andersonii.AAC.1
MGGAPPLPKGETLPGLSEQELSELRMKALLALRRPAPSAGSGLILAFCEAFSEIAGDPDVDFAPWIRTGAPLGVLRPVTSRGCFPQSRKGPWPLSGRWQR